MINKDTGLLINGNDIKGLNRPYFKEMVKLLGLKVLYRVPKPDKKDYNLYGELDAEYESPVLVGCIYDEHPTQKTMRKLGWDSELNDSTTVIHVPYDLENLQAGCIFIIPSGVDNSEARVFRVLRMSNIAIYPSSIACELAPVYKNNQPKSTTEDFKDSNFNLLGDEEDEYNY